MNRFSLALICLFLTSKISKWNFYTFNFLIHYKFIVSYVKASDDNSLTKEEIFALTRDGLSRDNPDALLNGYFAAWPAVLYILAGIY